MKIYDLQKTIDSLLKNQKTYHAVLIDGPWGCGKTTAVKEAIKSFKHKKIKIYYQSLFGIKEINELSQCFKKAGVIKSIGRTLIPLLQIVPLEGKDIYKKLDEFLTRIPTERKLPKKNAIFIFDDFERIGTNFSYIELLGFFNLLVLNGCTLICLSSLGDLEKLKDKDKNVEKRIFEIETFKEKVFDRVYHINEHPFESLEKDLLSIDVKLTHNEIKIFNNNFRFFNRTIRLYKEIESLEKNNNFNLSKYFTKNQVLRACACVIQSVYEASYDKNKTKDSYLYLENKESDRPLDDNVWLTINAKIKDSKIFKPEEKDIIHNLCKSIGKYEVHGDSNDLLESYPNEVETVGSNNILNTESFFYLGDEDKKTYYSEFKKASMKNNLKIDNWFVDRFCEIVAYSDLINSDQEFLNFIRDALVKQSSNGDEGAYRRLKDQSRHNAQTNYENVINPLVENIEKLLKQNFIEDKQKKLINNDGTINYEFLCDFVYDLTQYKFVNRPHVIEWFDSQLLVNDYYLPNLDKTINRKQWEYCHTLCSYCSKTNNNALKEGLLKSLTQKLIKSSSNSGVDRLKFLLTTYFK